MTDHAARRNAVLKAARAAGCICTLTVIFTNAGPGRAPSVRVTHENGCALASPKSRAWDNEP